MRILELDAGNSRLKWRLLISDCRVAHGFLANSDDWQHELPRLLGQIGQVDCARASIVSGDQHFDWLSSAVACHCNVPLFKAEVKPQWRGVRVAYPGLGVDRWLAMLAAHHAGGSANKETGKNRNKNNRNKKSSNKLVVSCGTAITIDVLSGEGGHLGGYIVPGFGLMKRMLYINTAQLPKVEARVEAGVEGAAATISPGTSSVDCINKGILAMVVAMMNTQQEKYKDYVVYLTGGDAALIQRYIHGACYHHPELVLDGLALAFEQAAGIKECV